MAYNPKYLKKTYEYRKNNLKRVGIDFNNTYYTEVLQPAIEKSGMTISGFIKEAINEKIDRESGDLTE